MGGEFQGLLVLIKNEKASGTTVLKEPDKRWKKHGNEVDIGYEFHMLITKLLMTTLVYGGRLGSCVFAVVTGRVATSYGYTRL